MAILAAALAANCSYNGEHRGGRCVCAPQWTGPQCDAFSFAPLQPGAGYQPPGASSWGGSVLRGDDGRYHMWAAEMTEHTGIKAWVTNSQVVHAVAQAPAPHRFERRGTVWPVFAHEPTVARAPTGEYVMFFTTNFNATPGSQCNPPCTCGRNGTSCLSCPNDQQCGCAALPHGCSPLSTRVSHASGPDGPWSPPVLVPAPTAGDTNLACIIRANHSLVCLGRPGLGALHADDWRDVAGYAWHRTAGDPIRGEDPMVWRDAAADVLHAVTHGGGWGQPYGFHYWSTDGGWSWFGTQNKAYSNVVQLAGGGTKILSRRERPHVVLDARGQLLALTNGVTEAWPCTLQREPDRPPCRHPYTPGVNPHCGPGSNGTSIWCPVDRSWTMWQPFNR